jgi:hypothetical protein
MVMLSSAVALSLLVISVAPAGAAALSANVIRPIQSILVQSWAVDYQNNDYDLLKDKCNDGYPKPPKDKDGYPKPPKDKDGYPKPPKDKDKCPTPTPAPSPTARPYPYP